MSLFRNLLIDKKRRRFYCEVEFITFGEGQYIMYNGEQFPSQPSTIYKYENLLPVLDWNMTPCMYDKVSGELFYNKGTGSFSYGRQIHQVDYIQTIYSADGNSFIDTGYYPNLNTKVEFMASGISADTFAGSSGGTWFTGGRQAYLQKMFGSYYNPSSQNLYFGFSTTLNYVAYSTANMYGDNKKFVLDKTGLYINDTKIVDNTNTTDFTSPATLAIFGLNNNGSIISPTAMKLQYYKVWDNGILVRDYIPMIDESGKGALFDKATHTIYDAVGLGTGFNYPPVELEYLESTALDNYIDTGLDYFADFEIGIQLRESVSNKALGNGAFYCLQRFNASNPYWYFSTGSGTSNSYITSTPITEYHVMKWKGNKIYADDVLLTEFTKNSNTPNRMYLYSVDGNNNYPNVIYFCKLWNPDDGTLVRDFIPCYKDGVSGMWDKVNSVFYPNAGQGAFVGGSVKEDEYE